MLTLAALYDNYIDRRNSIEQNIDLILLFPN